MEAIVIQRLIFKVFFIRVSDVSQEGAIKLRDLFKNKYPSLNFELLVIGMNENFHEPWEEEKIRNFYSQAEINRALYKQVLLGILDE
ncbi:MAG: hypothetical protein HW387_989 [Parachlamydiales bacterium]|nr:hypothetical protein [Parachlamydiales bacterium]